VSNFDEEQLAEALRLGDVACNQVLYSMSERHIEKNLLPLCRKHGVALVGYSPFYGFEETAELEAVAKELRATPRQVALAFLVRLESTFAIPKASSLDHVRENAGAARLQLSASQIARLEKAFPLRVRQELPTA